MPRRFNNLDAALKYLNPKGTDGESTSEAPSGSQLRFYQDWKSGKRAVEYGDRAAGSKPGSLDAIIIKPFAFGSTDDKEYIVDISARSQENFSSVALSTGDLGIGADLTNGIEIVNFTPAKVTVSILGTTFTTTESKLTGRKYKKKSNSSYTFPFGRTTANSNYADQKSYILNKAKKKNTTVSFSPENYR